MCSGKSNTRPRAGYEKAAPRRRPLPLPAGQDADFISYAEAKRRTAIADMLVAEREAARPGRASSAASRKSRPCGRRA